MSKTFLMCRPDYFTVSYAINPWMRPGEPVDTGLAVRQWARLGDIYRELGHDVRLIDPRPGLPDMVYAANGATVVNGRVLGAKFRYPQRAAEAEAYLDWFAGNGWDKRYPARRLNEGEGDFLFTGEKLLCGYGFRSDREAAAEAGAAFGVPVLSLRLVDPRFYHLDTALCVLNASTAMYYPAAFDEESRAALAAEFTELIEAKDEDADVLGLNAVSDGTHVVLSQAATGLIAMLREHGFTPVGVDLSELLKGGGGPKCCTLELRS